MGVVDVRDRQLICPMFNAGAQFAVNGLEEAVRDVELGVTLDIAAWAEKICAAAMLASKTTSNVIVLIVAGIRLCNDLSLSSLFEINALH
jgi:hypothetical protein